MKNQMTSQYWTNTLSFILTTTGAIVGLGNLWKFPYEAGLYGGSTFVIFYMLFLFLIGIPMLIGEMLIGKITHRNPVDALKAIATRAGSSQLWGYLGWFGGIILVGILAFYSIVAGWICFHTFKATYSAFFEVPSNSLLHAGAYEPINAFMSTGFFLLITGLVVGMGLHRGLERCSLVLMPLLLIGLSTLCISHIHTSGFTATVQFMFQINIAQISFTALLAALSHALFTLALGAGCMLTYGCYISSNIHLPRAALIIATLNLVCALLSGFAFFPILFNANIPLTPGPSLMFEALPQAIAHWPYASMASITFYLLLFAAALTSSVSLVEPWVLLLQARLPIPRIYCSLGVCAIGMVLAIPAIYSMVFFEQLIDIITRWMLPIGSLLFTVFAGWIVDKKHWQLTGSYWLNSGIRTCCQLVAPIAICVTLLSSKL